MTTHRIRGNRPQEASIGASHGRLEKLENAFADFNWLLAEVFITNFKKALGFDLCSQCLALANHVSNRLAQVASHTVPTFNSGEAHRGLPE
jgi:hypothetical protein